jgi:predicted HicB family RNase H-like nuclease
MKRRKPKRQRKEGTIQIRVSFEQKEALVSAAHRAGLELSSWLRQIGLREAGWIPPQK